MMLRGKWLLPVGGIVALGATGLLWLVGGMHPPHDSSTGRPATGKPMPPQFIAGETLFHTHCAICHGPSGVGTERGPSLLSKIYVPSHHSDASFYLSVKQGVRAHHWNFGNMPALPHVTEDEVSQIVAYARWLQQQAGVY